MADPQRDRERQPVQQIQLSRGYDPIPKSRMAQKGGPSTTQILLMLLGLPVGFTLLILAGITLTGTVIGLCLCIPPFVIFSPVLVPTAITIGLAVTGFLTSWAFGLMARSSFSWVFSSFQQATGSLPGVADQAKKRMVDVAAYAGQKMKEGGQEIQGRAQETGRTEVGRPEAGKTGK